MTTGLVAFCLVGLAGMLAAGVLALQMMIRGRRREGRYDLLYSLRWGETTTNNYGFAPAETGDSECFQLQLYAELLKLLGAPGAAAGIGRVLEISCGRGGGLRHAARHLPGATQVIGLDFSAHAIRFCRARYAALPGMSFVRGHALQLPFEDGAFDLVINVEASHAYGDEAAFLARSGASCGQEAGCCTATIGGSASCPAWSSGCAPPASPAPCTTSRRTWCARASWTACGAGG